MSWDDGLNEQQKAAIQKDIRHVAVVAGPGTGKTKTLLRKAVQLVEQELATSGDIRLANFTNAGVHDLRKKIVTEAEYGALDANNVTTFHSLALRSLRSGSVASIPKPLSVLDDWEERTFVDQFAKDRLGIRNIRTAKKRREDYNTRWCMATEDAASWLSQGERSEYEGVYNQAKELLGFTTRGELTFLWWRFLASQPGASSKDTGFPWTYFLVDEYQDLNECEHQILEMLALGGVSLFAVGDPNQAVYEGLRHAHPELCWTFPDRLSPGAIEVLRQSYRCPRSVLRFGRAVFSSPTGVPDPDLSPEEGEAEIIAFPSDDGEVSGIGVLIRHLVSSDPESSVLIAVSNRRLGKRFADELANDVTVEDRTTKAQEGPEECRLARALLDILREPQDSVAIATALILKCAPTTRNHRVLELLNMAEQRSQSVADMYSSDLDLPRQLDGARDWVREAVKVLSSSDHPLNELREMTGCETDVSDIEEAREEISRRLDAETQLEPGMVTIMTLHSAKGMQADYAFLPGTEAGMMERDTLGWEREERRRLLYVGMTRAIKGLFISYANRRRGPIRYSGTRPDTWRAGPSVFLQEICDRTGYQIRTGQDYLTARLAN